MSILISPADAVKTVPEIIRAASSSPLGILALIILMLGCLAYTYFKNAHLNVRVGIFSALLLGGALYAVAILRTAQRGESEHPRHADESTSFAYIDGVVADANGGKSIALATITTVLSASPAITDSNGIFHLTIKSPRAGAAVVLHVAKDGYEPLDWTVTPPLNDGIRILLTKEPSAPPTGPSGSATATPPVPSRQQPTPPASIPGNRPDDATAFHEGLPDRVTVIVVGGNGTRVTASYFTKVLQKERASGLLAVGDEHPLTVYVSNGVFYVDASITEGVGRSVIEIKRNNFTITPPDWDRNYSANAIEIVNAHEQPIFQMIRRRSNVIEISGIFAGKKAIFDARPGKLLFRYPSWKYPGQYANDEDNQHQIDPALARATDAELQSRVLALCGEIRVLGKKWDDGYRANLSSPTRVADNEHLYRLLEQQFNKNYGPSARSLNAILERRLDSPEVVLNWDDNRIPMLLSSGVATGPNPFKGVCDYLEALGTRLH